MDLEKIQVQTAILTKFFERSVCKRELELYPRKEAILRALADMIYNAQGSNWEISMGFLRYLVLTVYGLSREDVVEIGRNMDSSPAIFKAFIRHLLINSHEPCLG